GFGVAASRTQMATASASDVATRLAPTALLHSSPFSGSFANIQKQARNFELGIIRLKRRMRKRTCAGLRTAPKYERQTSGASRASILKDLAEATSAKGCIFAGSPCFSNSWASMMAAASSNGLRLAMQRTG